MLTMKNPYDIYRERLAALATDEIPLAAMDKAALQHGWWAQNRRWQRTYGRFHLGEAPLVTLIYESADAPQEICIIDLLTMSPTVPHTAIGAGQALIQEKIGWLQLTHFPHDPQLPSLARLLSLPGQPSVLRYRPQKRCTLRFTGSSAGGDAYRFAKVFNDDRGAAIHGESLALWQAANHGELDFAVARPLAWDATLQTLWQGAVPGQPLVKRLLSPDGPDLAERMGRAAASLTRSSLRPLQITDGQKQQKRSASYAKRLRTFFPALAPAIDLLMDKLAAAHRTIGPTCLRPIHGAPHAHQWLEEDGRLGLVDFDGFALGDPELDAATFMAELDFEDWEKAPIAAINQRFLAGYEAVAGPLDERLLYTYRAHKRLSKALRNAYAIRDDNDMRVERALGQAITCVLQAM
jgi:thiamine kinase-like enzyme